MRTRIVAAAILLFAAGSAVRAAEPTPLPPAAGLSEAQAIERAALFAELAATKSDAEARAVEERIWMFWRGFADAQSREFLAEAREAQLRFDYDEALIYLKALVKHTPGFAEGWNQLGYAYFLAGKLDEARAAIAHVLALEPLHYAALAGEGIILYQQGKIDEAQAPLKRALAIDPWLKERNLILDRDRPRASSIRRSDPRRADNLKTSGEHLSRGTRAPGRASHTPGSVIANRSN